MFLWLNRLALQERCKYMIDVIFYRYGEGSVPSDMLSSLDTAKQRCYASSTTHGGVPTSMLGVTRSIFKRDAETDDVYAGGGGGDGSTDARNGYFIKDKSLAGDDCDVIHAASQTASLTSKSQQRKRGHGHTIAVSVMMSCGWKETDGLGPRGDGIREPVVALKRAARSGVGWYVIVCVCLQLWLRHLC